MGRIRLGIVVPVANEEDTIDELIDLILRNIGPDDCVFFVTDNVSKDRTRSKIASWAEKERRIREVFCPQDRCVVDAYFNGYRAAYDSGSKWILEMDGGLSHDPNLIPRFVQAMEDGALFASGSRFIKGSVYPGLGYRKFISRGGSILANIVLGTKLKDMTSGYECFSRPAMELVLARGVRSKAHFFQTEIKYMLRGLNTKEVPISYKSPSNRLKGDSLSEAFKILFSMREKQPRGRRS